ncbi:MAG: OmpA family protein [Solirubrobacteraceae bacterium]|jgi:chemotaxis protein MotB
MSSARQRHNGPPPNEDRWLLTYSDMITLLMALFMVLFSISSVNISKYTTLQQALKAAFSGSILPGGTAVQQGGNTPSSSQVPATSQPAAFVPAAPSLGINGGSAAQKSALRAQQEQDNFLEVQRLVQAYANAHGLSQWVHASITSKGLQISILSDHLLFASGEATLQPDAYPLLADISHLLGVVPNDPVVVEGYTDSVPTNSALYPSNWYLSTDRANAVLQYLITLGINPNRLSAEGFASLDPVASNATAAGRALNRRVVIGIERVNTAENYVIGQSASSTSSSSATTPATTP